MPSFKLSDRRTGGLRVCKCGLLASYHKSEPLYFGGERFNAWTPDGGTARGCNGFTENPKELTFEASFARRMGGPGR